MRKGDVRKIVVDGKAMEATFLGRGRYAKAFQHGETVYLFVKGCYMKNALTEFAESMPHLPAIVQHDSEEDRDGAVYVFSMPFYRTLTAGDIRAWADYKELKRANEQAYKEVCGGMPGFKDRRSLQTHGYEVNRRMIDLAQVSDELKAALSELADAICNYGSGCTFEFAPRNLGVDAEGRLILRDIAFDSEEVERERMEKAKRARQRQYCF